MGNSSPFSGWNKAHRKWIINMLTSSTHRPHPPINRQTKQIYIHTPTRLLPSATVKFDYKLTNMLVTELLCYQRRSIQLRAVKWFVCPTVGSRMGNKSIELLLESLLICYCICANFIILSKSFHHLFRNCAVQQETLKK